MSSPALWVNSTYFAEGLPYTLLMNLTAVYFTDMGVTTEHLGYLNFLGIPWNLKFLWAPMVDRYGTHRRWLVGLQLLLGVLMAGIAGLAVLTAHAPGNATLLMAMAALFALMAFPSATNDIAIDGFYLRALPDKREQARYTGLRVLAYRAAMVFARTGLVALAAWMGHRMGVPAGWAWAFAGAAAMLLLLAAVHQVVLPRLPARPPQTSLVSDYTRAWLSYFRQERMGITLAFIALYKMGDGILFSMTTTFLKRQLLVSNDQFAWIGGVVGAGGTILGAMWGAAWIRRRGLTRSIWPLTLLMNLNIWAYIWLAWAHPLATTPRGLALIAALHGYEQIAAGLGNAVLVTYLLRTCRPEHSAAHYAMGSAVMSLGASVIGGFGGKVVAHSSFLTLFVIAFIASVPAMVLLKWVPMRSAPGSAADQKA